MLRPWRRTLRSAALGFVGVQVLGALAIGVARALGATPVTVVPEAWSSLVTMELLGLLVTVAAGPDAPAVLVVTTFDLDEYVFGALEAGASGFLLKDAEPDELVAAVRRLTDGSGLLDQAVTRRVMAEFARRHAVPESGAAVYGLTARAADIVRVLAQGRSNEEIAGELFIETSTGQRFSPVPG